MVKIDISREAFRPNFKVGSTRARAGTPVFTSFSNQPAQARIFSMSGPFGVRPKLNGADASRHLA